MSGINYAHYLGIHSTAAAVVFAVLYVPLFAWFLLRAIRHTTYVHVYMTIFCTIRITSYILRAVMAQSATAGENSGLLIAYEILYSVGFFGLLYSAYVLILNRETLSEAKTSPLDRLLRNRALFRIIMIAAVAMGISGATKAFSSTDPGNSTGTTLRTVSTAIFLALTVVVGFQAVQLLLAEDHWSLQHGQEHGAFGRTYGGRILLAVCVLLLIREAFLTATIHNAAVQNNEHFWYPLAATPEIIAVVLYGIPGLVPPPAELPK